MNNPKCFISYSWDSPLHKDWVRFLAEQLQENGVYVLLDQWDVSLGDQLTEFMESSIRESDYVLLICTPNFATKANAGKGGVGYEKSIVTGEIFTNSAPDTKYVALLRQGSQIESIPSYLKSKAYIDFRSDSTVKLCIEELLRHFHEEPRFIRPPLGKKPQFNAQLKDVPSNPKTKDSVIPKNASDDFNIFKSLFEFAKSPGGLNKYTDDAERWANNKMEFFQGKEFKKYKELFEFAKSPGGLNKYTDDAERWAYNKLKNA